MGLASADPPLDGGSSASLPRLHACCRKIFTPLICKQLEEASVLKGTKWYLGLVKKTPWKGILDSERKKILGLQARDMIHSQIQRCRLYVDSYSGLQSLCIL